MTNITPPPPSASSVPSGTVTAQTGHPVQAVSLSADLADRSQSQPTQIRGTVQSIQTETRQAVIRTAQGTVTISTAELPASVLKNLQAGASVLLTLPPATQQPQPAPQPGTPVLLTLLKGPSTPGSSLQGSSTPAVQADSLKLGTTPLRGLLIVPSGTATPAHSSSLPAGSVPQGGHGVQAGGTPTQNSPGSSGQAAGLLPATANLKAGTVLQLLPHSPGTLHAQASTQGNTPAFTATAVGQHAGGTILNSPLGQILVAGLNHLAEGESISLRLVSVENPLALLSKTLNPDERLHEDLRQALAILNSYGQGQQFHNSLPQPDTKLTSKLLFFLNALNITPRQSFETLPLFQALADLGEDQLLQRLLQDLPTLGRSIETPAGDWRAMHIPLWIDGQLETLRFHIRDQEQQDSEQDPQDKTTRFQLELNLRAVGDMQLDGLVKSKRFDLIIRTRSPLPAQMTRDIQQLFSDSVSATGYEGALRFEASADWTSLQNHSVQTQDHSI
ncbi:hypothetical protein [Kiloniella sp. b19]|uniref:hypothetical protein n=1 Tax=Kiloniella sp. GXU_MW_B19 TaxID=3141326 RepID=UPI0031D1669B